MITATKNRLQDQTDGILVKGAVELEAAQAEQKQDTLYVLPLDSNASGNALENAVRQQVTEGIAVVIAVTNRRDRRGEAGLDEIEVRRNEVRAALLGWPPTDDGDPLIYRRGRLLALADKTVWWQDEYEHTTLISAV